MFESTKTWRILSYFIREGGLSVRMCVCACMRPKWPSPDLVGTETKRGKLDHILIRLENTYRNLRLYLLSSMCVYIQFIIVNGGTRNVIFILPHFEI